MLERRENYLKRRSSYLRRQLESRGLLDLFSLVQEKFDSIDRSFHVMQRIKKAIDALPLSEDRFSVPSMLRASFRDLLFRRLEEIEAEINSLDEVWGSYIAFEDFSRRFQEVHLVLSRFLNEVSSPLGRTCSCMILPGRHFGYLGFINVSKHLFRIFVPVSAIKETRVWPILAHEIGHAYLFLPRVHEKISTELAPRISEVVRSICERLERTRENLEVTEYFLSRSWYQWLMEIGADLFALRRVGPSFVSALMLELMPSDPFSLGLEPAGPWVVSTHPPPDFRVRLVIRHSREAFPSLSKNVSMLEDMWEREVSSRVSDTLEERRELYDLLCTDEILRPLEEKMVDLLAETVPLQDASILPLEAILSSTEISVTRALLSLIFFFFSEEYLIDKLAERIRQEASKRA